MSVSHGKTIAALVDEIEQSVEHGDDRVVHAALLFREVRARIEAGELGDGVNWRVWMRDNISRMSKSRLYELMQIADAPDPYEELKRLRGLARERQKAFRERTKRERDDLEVERQDIMEWAETAPINEVRYIRDQIIRRKYRAQINAGAQA